MNQRKPTTDEPIDQRTDRGLGVAVRNLTDGVTDLVRCQFQMLRIETKREATEAGKRGGMMAAVGGIALVGYGLLMVGLVLVGGWIWGIGGAAVTALVLGAVHVLIGAVGAWRGIEGFREQEQRIEEKTQNLTGSGNPPWLEEKAES